MHDSSPCANVARACLPAVFLAVRHLPASLILMKQVPCQSVTEIDFFFFNVSFSLSEGRKEQKQSSRV